MHSRALLGPARDRSVVCGRRQARTAMTTLLSLHAASTRSFVQPARKAKTVVFVQACTGTQFMFKTRIEGSRTTAAAATGRATYQGTTMTAIIDSARPLPGCGRPVVT